MSQEVLQDQKHPFVCIVLAIHNGADHLKAQLQSYRAQTLPPRLVISGDDGSSDGSLECVRQFFRSWPECGLRTMPGPQKGYAANFLKLLQAVPEDADYVALSDQDDEWYPDKTARAIAQLQSAEGPALYGAATWVCDADLVPVAPSRILRIEPGFAHALTQNFAGGNTMVLNRAGMELVQRALARCGNIPVHDWWLYQLIAGAGGAVIYDPEPCLSYRQHVGNQIGSNAGMRALLLRLREMFKGTYRNWNSANFEALLSCHALLDPAARAQLEDVATQRDKGVLARVGALRRNRLRRQGTIGQLGLWLSVLLNRF